MEGVMKLIKGSYRALWIVFVVLFAGCQSTVTMPAPATERPVLPSATALPPTATTTPTVHPVPEQENPPSVSESFEGIIAFYSDRDGNPEIYIMPATGGEATRLTDDPAFDDSPALSPDGAQILFLTARHDPNPRFPNLKYELYVMNSDGSDLRRLTNTEAAEDHPDWSPDGSKIIFDADYDGDGFYEIYTLDADGTNLTRLTANNANDQFAHWSPDGQQIAFASDRNDNWDIFVMDADGGNQRSLTGSPDWELFPAWSPDGMQIAFNGLAPRSRNTDVFVMNADGSDMRQLTTAPGFDENPAWSPDGQWLLFQTQRDGNFELYIMRPDGNEQRPLEEHPADELWPSWGLVAPSAAALLSLEKSPQELGMRETFQAALGDLYGDGDLDAVFVCHQDSAAAEAGRWCAQLAKA
jgi:TolB protein